jgi:hypothetical protein
LLAGTVTLSCFEHDAERYRGFVDLILRFTIKVIFLILLGTGKTFIGAILAGHFMSRLGQRLLVCCYTNHALDQFLECILDKHPSTKLVRIGGSCKSERLARYSLRNLTKERCLDARREYGKLKAKMEELNSNIEDNINKTRVYKTQNGRKTIYRYLCREHSRIARDFAVGTALNKEFISIGVSGKHIDEFYLFEEWCLGHPLPKQFSAKATSEYWKMSHKDREKQFSLWRDMYQEPIRERILHDLKEISALTQEMKAINDRSDADALRDADIIACTTWGAAQYADMISELTTPTMIVEEAGEVLEAHILTAVPRKCKKLVLIGDHKQLRPKVESYVLQRESGYGYNLNVSLFERLAPTLGCAQLKVRTCKAIGFSISRASSTCVLCHLVIHRLLFGLARSSIECVPQLPKLLEESHTQSYLMQSTHAIEPESTVCRTI